MSPFPTCELVSRKIPQMDNDDDDEMIYDDDDKWYYSISLISIRKRLKEFCIKIKVQ